MVQGSFLVIKLSREVPVPITGWTKPLVTPCYVKNATTTPLTYGCMETIRPYVIPSARDTPIPTAIKFPSGSSEPHKLTISNSVITRDTLNFACAN